MFQPDVLRWKCFAPHPFWEGSRGYALRYQGAIAAFGCMVPCRFLTGAGPVASCNMIDWAARKTVPGAGAMLYRHIQELTGTMINIGGTAEARILLPQIGFQARVERHRYARVLRPWRHFQQARPKDWKSPLRLARDLGALGRIFSDAGALVARRADGPPDFPAEVLPDPAVTNQTVCERSPELVAYTLACPAARMDAFVLERDHAPAGYFLLSRIGFECRIADLWIRSNDPRVWAEAYAAATAAASSDPGINEVTAAASAPLETGALQRAGFRRTHSEPVFVKDPENRLADRKDFAIGFLENDGYYWRTD